MVEYRAAKGGKVRIYYKMRTGEAEELDYQSEGLTPMYENIYVKKFVLFANETLKYYFKETIDGNTYRSEKAVCVKDVKAGENGRYGRLNDILLADDESKEKKMREYAQEDMIAAHMFEL